MPSQPLTSIPSRPDAGPVTGPAVQPVAGPTSGLVARKRSSRAPSEYAALATEIREAGLLRRAYGYYGVLTGVNVVLFVGALTWTALLGPSWWQLVPAAVVGLVVAQFGFLGHEAAHRQIFATASANEWAARILSGAFAGLSYGWWKDKHNRHHAAPNQEGRDPDIAPGALAFTAEIAAQRTTGFRGWFQDHQGWLFFPLLTFEGLNLQYAGVRVLLGRDPVQRRGVEATLVFARLLALPVFLLLLLPTGMAIAYWATSMAVLGVNLGASFAPNHKGMPIVPREAKIDFLRRQVLMSRNVRGGFFNDLFMGGLNYQVEHHLFPSMPRANLRRAQVLVRAHCARWDIPYTEVGLLRSYAIVLAYLNEVGLRASNPFECPMLVDLRS